jgi:hypothetical protein
MDEQEPFDEQSDRDELEDDPRFESGEESIDESGRNPTQRRIDEELGIDEGEFEPDSAA